MRVLSWIAGVIIIIWLLTFLFDIGGSLIHLLLVIAIILFIADKLSGKKL